MFFLLSKTLYFLAKPFTWVVLSLILSVFVKRHRARFFSIGMGLLLVLSNPFLSNLAMRAWEASPVPIATMPTYRVGIVLGGITTDKEPRDRVHVSGSADRILHAVQLYRQKKIEKILVSGGSGKLLKDQVAEAVLLERLLLLSGIPPRDIIVEEASRNTRENALNCARVLEAQGLDGEYLLITSAFHMRRAEACFVKANLMVSTFGVGFWSDQPEYTPDQMLPSAGAIEGWEIIVREMVGMLVYSLVGYI